MNGVETDLPPGTPPLPPPLLGLFRALLRAGVRLGVRDYLDALRALQAGSGGGTRDDLARLAEALWARGTDERRRVRRWFATLPPTPEAVGLPIEDAWIAVAARLSGADAVGTSAADRPTAATPTSASADARASNTAAPDAAAPSGVGAAAPVNSSHARIAFGPGAESDGLALPHLSAEPLLHDEFVLDPQPLVPLRQLAVTWRRYRRAERRGPRVELDLPATIRQRCEQGLLGAPALRPRRRNAARLLVLADASPSMTPWLHFLHTLEQSLAFGRLGTATLRWFGNVPLPQVHPTPRLDAPEACEEWLARHAGAGVLVVSDAGSARGRLHARRLRATREFVARAAAVCGRVVWLNPMPAARWEGSTAAVLAAEPGLVMLPLDAHALLSAVDILRGHKSGAAGPAGAGEPP